jgi:O-antigen/teichoic acid export membrane protein
MPRSTTATVIRNTIANWVGNVSHILILLFLTPFLLEGLGKDRFGIYAIARDALMYASLLTLGMRAGVNRFICRDIAANDHGRLNTTLSTMAAIFTGLGILGFIFFVVFSLIVVGFFNIDEAHAFESRFLFVALGFFFVLELQVFAYKGVLIGHQRFDLLNIGEIVREVVRALTIVIAFSLGWVSLGAPGLGMVGSALSGTLLFAMLAHSKQPGLRLRISSVSKESAKELTSFSIWNGVVQIGNVISAATPALVIARVLGTDQVVYFAIPYMLLDRLRVLVAGLASTLAPIAASTLVSGDREQFKRLIIKGCRTAAAFCIPTGVVALVFCKPFLTVWLGPEYAWSWMVYAVILVGRVGRISQIPAIHVLVGGGQIRGLAKIQALSAIVSLALMIVLASYTEWGVMGVAIGMSVPLLLSHSVGLPIYVAAQARTSVWRYYADIFTGPLISAVPGALIGLLLIWFYWPTNYYVLVAEGVVAGSISMAVAFYTCFDQSLRQRLLKKVGLARKANPSENP